MTLSVQAQASPITSKLVVETAAGATPDNNVLGAAGSIYQIDVDNAANAAASYLKLYDAAAPTVGTTAPDAVLRVPAGQRRQWVIPEGWAFTILSFACVTAGGTTGVTAPTHPVVVRLTCL